MSEERTTMNVIVNKAIELRSGETLNKFTSELRAAAKAHVLKKLNIAETEGTAFLVEVFSKTVVVQAYKFKDPPSKDRMLAMTFDRQKSGAFEFGDTAEVERVTSFQAKTVTTSKRLRRASDVVATSVDGAKYMRAGTG